MKKKRMSGISPAKGRFLKMLRIMRLSLIFICWGLIQVSANTYSQNTRLDVKLENASIKKLFKDIKDQSEFTFVYNVDDVEKLGTLTCNFSQSTVEEILDYCLSLTDMTYAIRDKVIILVPKVRLQLNSDKPNDTEQPQKKQLKGKISDTKGDPIPGATVIVKGTTVGTITEGDGNFTLEVSTDAKTLVCSFVGFKSQEIPIGSKTSFVISLEELTVGLEEVVAVGYGTQKKISVTGAIVSVTGENLAKAPTASVTNALSGRVTGLTTVQSSGRPGRDEPLIYVRGVGSLAASNSTPLMLVDGVERPFSQIDPNEIESISILKDASATAVYGIRGANGVILVTTKRGVEGAPKISFSTSYGMQRAMNLPETADSYTYVTKYNELQRSDNPNSPVTFSPFVVDAFKTGKYPEVFFSTDWKDILVKKVAPQTQSNVNISGGTKMVKYFVSMGYFNQSGLINSFDSPDYLAYKRFNYRANVDVDATKTTRFSLTVGGRNENRGWGQSDSDLWWWVWGANVPWSGKLLPDGRNVVSGTFYKPNAYGSPLYGRSSAALPYNTGRYSDVNNVMNLDVQITQKLDFLTKGLSWRLKASNNTTNSLSKTRTASQIVYDPMFKCDVDPTAVGDSTVVYRTEGEVGILNYSEGSSKTRNWYMESALAYNRDFGNHNITGLLLYNASRTFYPTTSTGAAMSYQDIPLGYVGLAARGTYDYKHKYLIDINLGYNGSENFAPDKRFGFFPAASVGWVPTEEDFLKGKLPSFLTYMKLRMSYGVVGNDKQGNNRFLYRPTAYSATSGGNMVANGYSFGTNVEQPVTLASDGKLGNPDVTWEKAKKQDYAIDLTLFRRLSLTAEYFYEIRNNILSTRNSVPSLLYLVLPAVNLGRVENYGYELEAKWNDKIGNVNYFVGGNWSFHRNKILFMDEITPKFDYLTKTGHSVDQPWAYVSDGFWTQEDIDHISDFPNPNFTPRAGDMRYKDINGDKMIDSYDQVATGYPAYPEIVFAINGGISYKGFDVSMLWQGATHVSKELATQYKYPFGDNGTRALMMYLANNSWTPETASTAIFPRMTFVNRANNYRTSNVWIKDATYIRLKNVEIGYTLRPELLKRWGISSVRVYTTGYDLLTFTKIEKSIDPEAPGGDPSYPLIQVTNFGLNVNF